MSEGSRENGIKNVAIKQNLLQRIVDALVKNKSTDNSQFYAKNELPMENLRIEVDKVGELSFPLPENCIKKLLSISSKTHFSSEQTLLDKNICSNQEITSDKLHISFNQQALDWMMNKFRNELGLGNNCVLFPYLHNMLIYSAGQFFDMHHDSEKLENKVGSLIIILPSSHIGGDLVIICGKKKYTFSSEAIFPVKAKCIAFFADCSHKVKTVRGGYRIVLTYNLLLKTEKLVAPSLVKRRLCKAIREYFDLKENEQKLVYFLNHTYPEPSLKWDILKREDHSNSLALYSAAKKLGLIPYLTLVNIKKIYEVSEFNVKQSFLDEQISLCSWVDSDNKEVPFSKYYVSHTDICFTKDTCEFGTYDETLESCTDNAGNKIYYWYRRAAIVIWPDSVKFSMNFFLGYDYFLGKLIELCKTPGNKKEVTEIVTKAGKNLYNCCVPTKYEQTNILKLSIIALYTESFETAFSLLAHFKFRDLKSDFAEPLVKLQLKYGVEWCINLFNKMKTNSDNLSLENSYLLIRSFLEHKVDTSVIKLLLHVQYEVITGEITRNRNTSLLDLKSSLTERIEKLHEFFKTCLICQDYIMLTKMIQNIVSNIQQYPLASLSNLYVELHENIQPEEIVHFQELRSYLTKNIDYKINSQMRNEDDWSVMVTLPCDCANCAIVTLFLQSKTEKTKVWPLREKLRNHIIEYLHSSGLPVKCTVKKIGSPHKLVLVKTIALQKDYTLKQFEELKLCQLNLRALND